MKVEKLIQLTERHRELEEQVEALVNERREIEEEIEYLVAKGGSNSQPARAASTKKKRKIKRKRKSGYKRASKAGDEISAIEALILEHFKKHPDTRVSCDDLYDLIGTESELDNSRVRAALTRLKKSQWIAKAARGVYVLLRRGGRRSRATEDEKTIVLAMDPGKPMRCKEILDRIRPPSYRKHALENRIWMMANAGILKKVDHGTYVLPGQ